MVSAGEKSNPTGVGLKIEVKLYDFRVHGGIEMQMIRTGSDCIPASDFVLGMNMNGL
jgi:hypothetical protein